MICNCALKYSKLFQINMVKTLLFGICEFPHDLDFHLFWRNRKSYLFHVPEGSAIIISYTWTKEYCKNLREKHKKGKWDFIEANSPIKIWERALLSKTYTIKLILIATVTFKEVKNERHNRDYFFHVGYQNNLFFLGWHSDFSGMLNLIHFSDHFPQLICIHMLSIGNIHNADCS